MRLDKEDNMTIDGAILTADSHGEKFQCNRYLAEDGWIERNPLKIRDIA